MEVQGRGYVLAVSGQTSVWRGLPQASVKTVLEDLEDGAWQRRSAGWGSKGPRRFEWQDVALTPPAEAVWRRGLLVRRRLTR